jgi:TolA-binding protein
MLTPKKKLTRHQMKEDKLVTVYFKIYDSIHQHSREILLAVLGVIAVLGGTFYLSRMRSEGENQAAVELAKGKMEFARRAYPASISILEKLLKEYDGTKGAGIGAIYLAHAYLQQQDYPNAQKTFEVYLNDYGDDELLAATASAGIAATYDERKEYAKAAELYEKTANKYDDVVHAPAWLMDAARCYKNAGNKPAAQQALQKLIEKYPKTAVIDDAKGCLAELGA